jgi:hypothetical protein
MAALSSKVDTFKHNSLVKEFLKAGWPETAVFWDSISTQKSRLSDKQTPGAPVAYDGSVAIWSPGDMIFKDICKVKQEPAVNEALYRSDWFSKGCLPGERAVLQGLAKTLRDLAPKMGFCSFAPLFGGSGLAPVVSVSPGGLVLALPRLALALPLLALVSRP